MSELLFLKLGGSLITDKQRQATVREDVIRRLAGEVRDALAVQDGLRLLIGHGSGSFGHYAAQQFGFAYEEQSDWRGFVEIGAAAARLNRIVMDTFLAGGVPVVAVQPSTSATCRAGQLVSMNSDFVRKAIDRQLVPVVYGDVCLDDKFGWTIVSTEKILVHLSAIFNPSRVILAGEIGGVYTHNPVQDADARLIDEISSANSDEVLRGLTGADGYDVTGGMLDKVEAMLALVQAQSNMEAHLISGAEPGQVQAALLGQPVSKCTIVRT